MTTQISLTTMTPEMTPRPLRIAFIIGGFPIPSQTFVFNQIIGLLQRGHHVDIYADQLPKKERTTTKIHSEVEANNLPQLVKYRPEFPETWGPRFLSGLYLLLVHGWKAPKVALRCLNFIKYGRQATSLKLLHWAIPSLNQPAYDIIHCHFGMFAINGVALRDVGAIQGKLVTTFYGADVSAYPQSFGSAVYNQLFDQCDLFIAISNFIGNKAVKLGCPQERLRKLPIGIDVEKFVFQSRSLPADKPVKLITVARLVEKKGLEYAIQAMAKVIEVYPNVEYEILGDGPLREPLTKLISKLGLVNTVKLLGWKTQDEVRQHYAEAHIFVLPSVTASSGDTEGQGLVLQEAQAMGLPIVATLHNGIPEGVLDGKSGFLVPERDAEALAGKLLFLLQNSNLWIEMGQAGRAYVEEQFDNSNLSDRLVEIYHQLLDAK